MNCCGVSLSLYPRKNIPEAWLPFSREYMCADLHLIIMTDLNAAHKRKSGSRLYHIAENDFATTIITKYR